MTKKEGWCLRTSSLCMRAASRRLSKTFLNTAGRKETSYSTFGNHHKKPFFTSFTILTNSTSPNKKNSNLSSSTSNRRSQRIRRNVTRKLETSKHKFSSFKISTTKRMKRSSSSGEKTNGNTNTGNTLISNSNHAGKRQKKNAASSAIL